MNRLKQFVTFFETLDGLVAPEVVSQNTNGVQFVDRPANRFQVNPLALGLSMWRQRTTCRQGTFWVQGIAQGRYRDFPVRFPLISRSVDLLLHNSFVSITAATEWEVFGSPRGASRLAASLEGVTDPASETDVARIAQEIAQDLVDDQFQWRLARTYGLWKTETAGDSATLFPNANGAARTAFATIYAPDERSDHAEDEADEATKRRVDELVTPVPLNAEQRFVVAEAERAPLTVISGPPGTGKTHVLTAILLEQLAARKPTLIVTATEPAREAIEAMLKSYPSLPIVRFGRAVSPQTVGNSLAEQASSLHVQGWSSDLKHTVKSQRAELARLRASATTLLDRNSQTDSLSRAQPRWWQRGPLRPPQPVDLEETTSLDVVLEQITELDREYRAAATELFVATYVTSVRPQQRRALAALARALRLDPMERRDALVDLSVDAVAATPIWLGTLDSVDSFLPPVEAMFDLVIFDEASQIGQLDAFGALRRASRCAVIGDPNQMRHEPHTTAMQRAQAIEAAELDAIDALIVDEASLSLFDVAASSAPTRRLVDHYRSSPHIIDFSNRHFYGNELRLMTRHPWRESRDSIHLVPARPTSGPIAKSQLATALEIAAEALGFGYGTVGVVVPDDEHVFTARQLARERLKAEWTDPSVLRIGVPRSYQGLEVDALVIVTGVSQGQNLPLDLDRLESYQDPNILNTIVTRARYDVYVVLGYEIDELPAGLWRDYLASESEPPLPVASTSGDGWKAYLATEIASVGQVPVRVDYPVGQHVIDVVAGDGRLALGIFTECDPAGSGAHIDRYLALRSVGWHLTHFFAPDWSGREPDAVIDIINRLRRRSSRSG